MPNEDALDRIIDECRRWPGPSPEPAPAAPVTPTEFLIEEEARRNPPEYVRWYTIGADVEGVPRLEKCYSCGALFPAGAGYGGECSSRCYADVRGIDAPGYWRTGCRMAIHRSGQPTPQERRRLGRGAE